jgi:hypothetical protein
MTAAPLIVGLALSVIAGVVRVRAWYRAVVHACPGESVRYRDVVIAHLGGAGLNGLVPAHGGDAVKLGLLKRRAPETPFGLLLGSLAPPAVVEALLTAALVMWAASTHLLEPPSLGQVPLPLVLGGIALVAGIVFLIARRAPNVLRDLRRGIEGLQHPKLLLSAIAPWLLAARAIRIAAICFFMAAVGLPVTLGGALLVMAIQGGVGAMGPATTPMRVAVLAASLPSVTGGAGGTTEAAALIAGTALALALVNLAISAIVVGISLRTASPRRVAAYCKAAAVRLRALPRPAPGEVRG